MVEPAFAPMDDAPRQADTARARRRDVGRFALFAATALAGALVVWQIGVYWRARMRETETPPRPPDTLRRRPSAPEDPSAPGVGGAGPDEYAASGRGARELAEGLSGVEPLGHDPGGIPPPPGAEAQPPLRLGGQPHVEFGRYECPGGREAVAEHYHRALTGRGFTFLGRRTEEDRRTMVYSRGSREVTLILRGPSGNGKMVRVTVAVTRRPAPVGAGRED